MTAAQLFADRDESPPDGWQVAFYADGKSTGGGIEFQDGEETYSLMIDPFSAKARVTDGKLPDFSNETWSAGGLAPRVQ